MVGVYRISFTARDRNIFGLTVQVSFGSAPVVVVCFSLYCRFAYDVIKFSNQKSLGLLNFYRHPV